MASIIKADNIQKVSDGSNIIKKCGSTITLGSCGATIALAAGATQTGFGQTYSAVEYCTTAKTSPFTAAAGTGYFINTTCGAVTVTLPASPTAGDVVAFKDYAGQWNTNNLTLCNNGNKINGVCATAKLSTQNQSVSLIYVDATKGWQDIQDSTAGVIGENFITATGGTITTSGDYKIHTFTSDGCFAVTASAIPANNVVDYLVVAGGGAGGWSCYGGGGGAGGFRESYVVGTSGCYTASPLASCTSLPVTTTTYPITVGGGGANPTLCVNGSNGSNSVFSTITSAGGGYGGIFNPSAPLIAGAPGGSGGGGGSLAVPPYPSVGPGGTGNTPPVAPPQGNNGGTGWHDGAVAALGGGGGGATAVGANGTVPGNGGAGGAGAGTAINPAVGTPGPSPTLTYFAGGGGGGCHTSAPAHRGTPVPGGVGGGGAGGSCSPSVNATPGTVNTGGGGGGTPVTPTSGGTGGSGIVIIRYKYQ
jgi:hypothetical protein